MVGSEATGQNIARVFSEDSTLPGLTSLAPIVAEAVANAVLIGAAPGLLAECKESRMEGPLLRRHRGSFARTLEALAAELTMEDTLADAGEWSDWLLSKAMYLDEAIAKAEGVECKTQLSS
jgi:hypothetical protein